MFGSIFVVSLIAGPSNFGSLRSHTPIGWERAVQNADFNAFETLAELRKLSKDKSALIRDAKSAEERSNLLKAANEELASKAKDAVKDLKIEEVEAEQCLPLAEIYAMARDLTSALKALDRFIPKAEVSEKFMAHNLGATFATAAKDFDALIRHTKGVPFSTGAQSSNFMRTWMQNAFWALNDAKGIEIARTEAEALQTRALAANGINAEQKASIRLSFAAELAEALDSAGRKPEAMAVLEAGIKDVDPSVARPLVMTKNRLSLIGNKAPALNVERGYGNFNAEAAKGKVVVVDFFAHWCGPCIASFPEMKEMYSEFKPKGFEIIGMTSYYGYYGQEKGITPDAEFQKMKGFIDQYQLPWPVLFGGRENGLNYGAMAIPYLVVIDKKGLVREIRVGYDPKSFPEFKKRIEALLSEN